MKVVFGNQRPSDTAMGQAVAESTRKALPKPLAPPPPGSEHLPFGSYLHRSGYRGPRVLLVIDQPGWAFDNISTRIVDRYSNDAMIDRLYLCGCPSGPEVSKFFSEHRYDTVVFFWFGQYRDYWWMLPRETRKVCLFFDLHSIDAFLNFKDVSGVSAVAGSNPLYRDLVSKRVNEVLECFDGVDSGMFHPATPIQTSGPLRLMWTGFSAHAGEDLKGYWSIISELPKVFGDQIELLVRDRVNGVYPHSSMPAWYNSGDVILCASSNEGTPNPVLEAAACGRPCITTNVGLVPLFVRGSGLVVERSLQAFVDAVQWMLDHRDEVSRMGEQARVVSTEWDWSRMVEQYSSVLALPPLTSPSGFGNGTPLEGPAGRVMAHILSTGRETELACKRALLRQTLVGPRVNVIRNVHPMSKAFQQMVDSTDTPFFIQVDEDMILDPGAVSRMLEYAESMPPDVWQAAFPLTDKHLGVPIIGCKIYRTEVAKRFPYDQLSDSCEVKQIKDAADGGYRTVILPLSVPPVGVHDIGSDPYVVADRYFRLGQKHKKYGYLWIADIPSILSKRMAACSDTKEIKTDMIAISALVMGMASGMATPGESDYTQLKSKYESIVVPIMGRETK